MLILINNLFDHSICADSFHYLIFLVFSYGFVVKILLTLNQSVPAISKWNKYIYDVLLKMLEKIIVLLYRSSKDLTPSYNLYLQGTDKIKKGVSLPYLCWSCPVQLAFLEFKSIYAALW